MASSFFALLDDIAVLARAAAASVDDIAAGAAKASAKASAVLIDDAAVTPQYVRGISPHRELPVVWRITKGSLLNKCLIVVAIMLLSVWAPWVFPWLLLIGGSYLAYEGAHKVWHWIDGLRGRSHEPTVDEIIERTEADEKEIVASAVRTDFVLSVEVMLISLASIDTDSWGIRLAILVVVALLMTVAVYGAVGLLVKMDDLGLWMSRIPKKWTQAIGTRLVKTMPAVFRGLTVIGTLAMLWVGGHILIVNLGKVGVPWGYDVLHMITDAVPGPGIVTWFVDSGLSALLGFAWGTVLVGIVIAVTKLRNRAKAGESSGSLPQ